MSGETSAHDKPAVEEQRPWWYQPEIGLLVLLVAGIYFSRLTALAVRGEESRWARGAVNMIESGDWVVPRQQQQVFVDRPPLASWAMALVGLARGKVDLVAIRLPSVVAVLLTTLLIYGYARTFLSRFGALAAGTVYATFGQVLQIGRLGDNEALFTLLVAGSLLIWHWGYVRRWPMLAVWTIGYALAGAGALQKGIQAPVYFVAATGVFLLVRRDWKWLFGWQHLVGIVALPAVIGGWWVPFYLATDWDSAVGVWTDTVAYRFKRGSLIEHIATYPLETFACLLPWSPFLLVGTTAGERKGLGKWPSHVLFAVLAIAVTYPTVWFVVAARGRYFMPLYPCFAVVIAWIIERCATAAMGSATRRAWQRYLLSLSVVIAGAGVFIFGVSVSGLPRFEQLAQPVLFAAALLACSCAVAWILVWARREAETYRARCALLAMAAFFGVAYTGAVVNGEARAANDLTGAVAELKAKLSSPDRLVSFGPVLHRFVYYYGTSIRELPWPATADDVPPDVTYFCFDHRPGDTPERRVNGRGLYWTTTSGTLPFEWEEVATLKMDRTRHDKPQHKVIVGRLVRGSRQLAESPSGENTSRR